MMSKVLPVWTFAVLAVSHSASAADIGLAWNKNFSVTAPTKAIAQRVARHADLYRRQIAQEWLGRPLKDGHQRTFITVKVSATEDNGRTWPIGRSSRSFHRVMLTTSAAEASGSTLKHEIAHVVFATAFGTNRLPVWLEEGIASRYDDRTRLQIRRRQLRQLFRQGNVQLALIHQRKGIAASQVTQYTVAESFTGYLLSRGSTKTLLQFASDTRQLGWDRATRKHYALRDLADLQAHWQQWARKQLRSP